MYKTVLVALDGSDLAECVLPHLEALAGMGALESIVLVRVVEPVPIATGSDFLITEDIAAKITEDHSREAEDYLSRVAGSLGRLAAKVTGKVLYGRAAETIADYATQNRVDLVLMATHGRSGITRWLLGSVADRVVRNAGVPVLLVRAPGSAPKD